MIPLYHAERVYHRDAIADIINSEELHIIKAKRLLYTGYARDDIRRDAPMIYKGDAFDDIPKPRFASVWIQKMLGKDRAFFGAANQT